MEDRVDGAWGEGDDSLPDGCFKAGAWWQGPALERLAARSTLLDGPGLLEQALQAVPVAVAVIGLDGQPILTNHRAEALTAAGSDPRRAVVFKAFTADGAPADLPHAQVLGCGQAVPSVQLLIEDRTGVQVPVLASAAPLWDRAGSLEAVLATFEDLTTRKAFATMRTQVQASDEISFETRLLGMVSHDLRDALQVITLANAALMRKERQLGASLTRGLRRIESATARATRLIRDLLDFTQLRMGGQLTLAPSKVDLDRVIDGALDEVQTRFPPRRIDRQRCGDVWGSWDPDRLTQIAVNLLTNAFKHSPESTPLGIRTVCEDGWACLEVHNLGEPIAAQHLGHVFQPLQRAGKPAGHPHGGLGLGLYIVDELVRSHHGQVTVQSSRENGTTFSVRLPRQGTAA